MHYRKTLWLLCADLDELGLLYHNTTLTLHAGLSFGIGNVDLPLVNVGLALRSLNAGLVLAIAGLVLEITGLMMLRRNVGLAHLMRNADLKPTQALGTICL